MKYDVVLIGGGIVGLATAYQILQMKPQFKVLLLEKEKEVGLHQTGRNSGVIHSGVYYRPGSLKAQNCLKGRSELLRFCKTRNIEHIKFGKVIVATQKAELPILQQIQEKGIANGVTLERVGKERLKEIEPHLTAVEGIWVPDVYSVQFRDVALELKTAIQELGGEVLCGRIVRRVDPKGVVETENQSFETQFIINCAGLFSDEIAKRSGLDVPFRIVPFRGEYYDIKPEKSHLVKGLIYPVPDPRFPFLGVHLTRMSNGKVEAGPNAVLAMAREGYKKTDFVWSDVKKILGYDGFWKMALRYWKAGCYEVVRSFNKKVFLRDVQRLVPEIEEADLVPGGTGVRAQVVLPNGKLLDDFALMKKENMIHVLNAPSPAATASFSIGRAVSEMLKESL
ncbi:MAG: L-2-hydroxyglutarate oxidase [Verrucomicrobia bacterium]|nr:L-2-hydroxyglutarate oxidase [Verrucomicrobiota bacterium]